MDELTISVVIADRTYRITIDRKDEEIVRRAVQGINDKVKEFSNLYAYKDQQDLIAMTVLQVNTELYKLRDKVDKENVIIVDKISELTKAVDDIYLIK